MDGLFFTFSTLLWLSVGRRTTIGQLGRPFTRLSVGELLLSLISARAPRPSFGGAICCTLSSQQLLGELHSAST